MEPGRDELVRRAWTLLGTAFMSQRAVWLTASQAEGLTPPQAIALMRLHPEDAPSLGDMARLLRCDASQMTSTADRLEERGLARRRTSPADRRVKELVLTDAGRRAQARLRNAFVRPPETFAELADEDLAVLVRVAELLARDAGADMRRLFGLPPADPVSG